MAYDDVGTGIVQPRKACKSVRGTSNRAVKQSSCGDKPSAREKFSLLPVTSKNAKGTW